MDQGSLVEMQIDDGKRLLEYLAREGVPVQGAFWAKETDGGIWFFYLITPLVTEAGGTRAVYFRINAVMDQMPEPLWISPLKIKVVGPTDPRARDVLNMLRRAGGARVSPIRWSATRLGDISVEDVYLYPLPVVTAG